ncbi:MAG: DinB family protein [Chloroflexota bacterium]|nr:DinB family protein [Chloroflexota bacterium]
MNETVETEAGAADRASIRAGLEATQARYQQAIAGIPDEGWRAASGSNPGWTRGALAWHVASSVNFIAGEIERARKGKALNPPSFLVPLVFRANGLRVKFASRKADRNSVLEDYDAAIARMLRLLDLVRDDEFGVSVTNFGTTQTIAELFGVPAEHLAEHVASLAGKQ